MGYTKIDQIIMENLECEIGSPLHASVKYYAETGNISGMLYARLKKAIGEASVETTPTSQEQCATTAVSKYEGLQGRELLLDFASYLNTYKGLQYIRFDFMMLDYMNKIKQ